jgi:hypothetical protein
VILDEKTEWNVCGAEDLSNFATDEIDSFGEVRRTESRRAVAIVGAAEPTFLGYPDTGRAASWANWGAGEPDKPLRRSDFSACEARGTCAGPRSRERLFCGNAGQQRDKVRRGGSPRPSLRARDEESRRRAGLLAPMNMRVMDNT